MMLSLYIIINLYIMYYVQLYIYILYHTLYKYIRPDDKGGGLMIIHLSPGVFMRARIRESKN